MDRTRPLLMTVFSVIFLSEVIRCPEKHMFLPIF
jgi:hypothetical protein